MSELSDWIGRRNPPAPEAFLPWLDAPPADMDDIPSALLELALVSLDEALARPGRNREGALHLLAADGFLTYACEAATETEDVGATLRSLLKRVAEHCE
ncbi:MAG: hypothetical protein BMS9Abin29_0515 [Gemmatimonadota bacterium]|nr:MAG: hypothetical protein BMS9Abin29_0515 [Gemmatimonadota bacterium]